MPLTLTEYKKMLADPAQRASNGIRLTGDQVAAILADEAATDSWYQSYVRLDAAGSTPATEPATAAFVPASVPVRPRKSGWVAPLIIFSTLGVVGAVAITAMIGSGYGQNYDPSAATNIADADTDSADDSDELPVDDGPDIPAGYTDAGNGVAIKTDHTKTCSYGKCAHLSVYAYDSCPSGVYLEAAVKDDSGVIVGMANDMITSLNAGDYADAELTILEDDGTKWQMKEVTCY